MTNLYGILNVDKNASTDEIRQAYKGLARKHHPDRGGDSELFKSINEAYDILSDKNKRKIYDIHGIDAVDNENQQFNPHQERKLNELHIIKKVNVPLEEIYNGVVREEIVKKEIICEACTGSGSTDKNQNYICKLCKGCGTTETFRQIGPFMQPIEIKCLECNGIGLNIPSDLICKICNGTSKKTIELKLDIDLKPGEIDRKQIIYKKKGNEDKDGNVGDIYFIICILENEDFKRIGDNLFINRDIFLSDAICGTKFILDIFGRTVVVRTGGIVINPYNQYKITGLGLNKGDIIIQFNIIFPDKNTIVPLFKKHMKKYLETAGEVDEVGIQTAKLLDCQPEDLPSEEIDDTQIPIPISGHPQQCNQQ